ncbi:MAG: DUF58 domain-containing protein [Verrucomicrobiota bacterium]
MTGGFPDPAALMSIRNLELRARAVVEGFTHGLHRSPYHGFSVEFTEYRAYTVGDDPRHIDWRLLGRTDRYFIKKFEDETNLRCHLLVDQSLSMTFGSRGFSKADYARTLAATLAYFLAQQGDATGLKVVQCANIFPLETGPDICAISCSRWKSRPRVDPLIWRRPCGGSRN